MLQRDKQELGQGGGRLELNDFQPSPPVKLEGAADLIETSDYSFDPVLLQTTRYLRSLLAEPVP